MGHLYNQPSSDPAASRVLFPHPQPHPQDQLSAGQEFCSALTHLLAVSVPELQSLESRQWVLITSANDTHTPSHTHIPQAAA